MRQATDVEIANLPYNTPFKEGVFELYYCTSDNEFMNMAMLVAKGESTDRNHPTGAVAVWDGQVISQLPNKAGYTNSCMIWLHSKGLCLRRILKIKSGTRYDLCRGCAQSADHAESRAAKKVLERFEHGLEGRGELYLWGHFWCCKPCCDAMQKAGIKKVILCEGAHNLFKR